MCITHRSEPTFRAKAKTITTKSTRCISLSRSESIKSTESCKRYARNGGSIRPNLPLSLPTKHSIKRCLQAQNSKPRKIKTIRKSHIDSSRGTRLSKHQINSMDIHRLNMIGVSTSAPIMKRQPAVQFSILRK